MNNALGDSVHCFSWEKVEEEDKNGAKFFDRFEDRKKGVGRKQSAFPDTYT